MLCRFMKGIVSVPHNDIKKYGWLSLNYNFLDKLQVNWCRLSMVRIEKFSGAKNICSIAGSGTS